MEEAATDGLIQQPTYSAAQMAEIDRATIKTLWRWLAWLTFLIAVVAIIVGSISLDKIRGAPEAVSDALASASADVMTDIDELLTPIVVDLQIKIATLNATLIYMQENCVCVAPTTAPPPTTAAPSSGKKRSVHSIKK
jgi:hypothetical protein